ncbi:hypothetical protein CYMTET_30349 [Cymbomonas tetramitiformis]|uniref:Uncharacterized protein n=1 Tax=Cymbomonas tetramitiformis TaxID=36881 RepID=A0AAE0FJ20_9CHLO|nr:hypothetical protein CYMTET_30349 [Cymbomonas tetramitiformis]
MYVAGSSGSVAGCYVVDAYQMWSPPPQFLFLLLLHRCSNFSIVLWKDGVVHFVVSLLVDLPYRLNLLCRVLADAFDLQLASFHMLRRPLVGGYQLNTGQWHPLLLVASLDTFTTDYRLCISIQQLFQLLTSLLAFDVLVDYIQLPVVCSVSVSGRWIVESDWWNTFSPCCLKVLAYGGRWQG